MNDAHIFLAIISSLTDIETDEEWETVSQVICELMEGEDEEEIEE